MATENKVKEVESTLVATNKVSSKSHQRSRDGIVVSDKMEKTVVVTVTRLVKHAAYGKYLKKTKRYYAHNEKNEAKVGDLVRIIETRPISKNKSWKVKEILRKAV